MGASEKLGTGAVLRLRKLGTDSKLSGMIHKGDRRKNITETYPDMSWSSRILPWFSEVFGL